MRKLTQGTIEYLVIDVQDQLKTITTLDGTSPTYTIIEVDTGTTKVNNQAALNQSMTVYCLADTTSGGNWAAGPYHLYIGFTIGAETPRLGPFKFRVEL